jgi:Protein of unknown function (DUF2442)
MAEVSWILIATKSTLPLTNRAMANNQWTNLVTPQELALQIAQARSAGELADQTEPRARSVVYDQAQDVVLIYLQTDVFVGIPRQLLQGLENATAGDLADFWLSSNGDALHWETLNASFSIPGLVAGVFGTKQWMATVGRKGGQAKTPAKTAASRANGKKGGRPRKLASSLPTKL